MKDDERYHFPFFWGHKVCLCLRLFICMCLWWSTKEGATASSACGCSNLGGNSRKAQWFSRVQGPHEQIEMENSDSYFSTEKGQFSFHRTMMCFFPPFFSIGFPFSYLGDTLWLGHQLGRCWLFGLWWSGSDAGHGIWTPNPRHHEEGAEKSTDFDVQRYMAWRSATAGVSWWNSRVDSKVRRFFLGQTKSVLVNLSHVILRVFGSWGTISSTRPSMSKLEMPPVCLRTKISARRFGCWTPQARRSFVARIGPTFPCLELDV